MPLLIGTAFRAAGADARAGASTTPAPLATNPDVTINSPAAITESMAMRFMRHPSLADQARY
jgi:hypothetical protein